MTPDAPSPRPADHAPPCSAAGPERRKRMRGQWRVLFLLLALGLGTSGGCALSPGYDLPSITTAGDSDSEFTTGNPTTTGPIAGTGGSSVATGGAPGYPGVGGTGGLGGADPCFDAPGGEGGARLNPISCGDPE